MTTFLEIAVNVPQVSGTFHYHLPPDMEGMVDIGTLVIIPFGRQMVQGVVLALVDDPTVPKTKPVLEVLDPEPVVTPSQIELARYLSGTSLTPLAACIALMLPPGLSQTADTRYQLTVAGQHRAGVLLEDQDSTTPQITGAQQRFIDLLAERGPLRGRQIDRALPRRNWKTTAGALRRKGLITSKPVLEAPKVRPKTVRTAQLACSPAQAEAQMETLSRAGTPALVRRQKIMRDPCSRSMAMNANCERVPGRTTRPSASTPFATRSSRIAPPSASSPTTPLNRQRRPQPASATIAVAAGPPQATTISRNSRFSSGAG